MSNDTNGWINYESYAVFQRLLQSDTDFSAVVTLIGEAGDDPVATAPQQLRPFVESLLNNESEGQGYGDLAANLLSHALEQVDWAAIVTQLLVVGAEGALPRG